jgi:hypothetical protein
VRVAVALGVTRRSCASKRKSLQPKGLRAQPWHHRSMQTLAYRIVVIVALTGCSKTGESGPTA